jgi:hypothetical protein
VGTSQLTLSLLSTFRCLVLGLCHGRAHAGTTLVPWRVWVSHEETGEEARRKRELTLFRRSLARSQNRPTRRDYQGPRHSLARADQDDEPQLHGAQVPSNQGGFRLSAVSLSCSLTSRLPPLAQQQPHPFVKVFRPRTPPEAIDLISKLLEYTPSARLTAIEGGFPS